MANKKTSVEDAVAAEDERADRAPGIRREAGAIAPAPAPPRRSGPFRRIAPFVQLALYYVVLIAVGAMLVMLFPAVRTAFLSPVSIPAVEGAGEILTGRVPAEAVTASSMDEVLRRATTTFFVILGALALIVPVARVYMQTKRMQYDPALVQSVVILPIVVAGIALVVKDSIALAFALAGIVAAVRFRNTLKDPRDAVYIFLVIGIGLSAGVQALDVALIISMIFNFVVLILWRFNIGSIYSGRFAETGVISAGDSALMLAGSPDRRRSIRRDLLEDAEEMDKLDGVLLVHARSPELARHTVQEALAELSKDWRLARIVPRPGDSETLEYLIRLKKKAKPTELVGALTERWGAQVSAAEYFWFRARERKRKKSDDDAED
jgi:hypothetical protein